MNKICLDGKLFDASEPTLIVANRGFRYGDGLFETMKVFRGQILLDSFHFDRFFQGLKLLRYEIPPLLTIKKLKTEIQGLCEKNKCGELARVRLTAFRGDGGLYDGDNSMHYSIECWPLDGSLNQLNENGLVIGVYTEAQKTCNIFSSLKSANFLPYTMAAIYAKENKWNDCLVLNTHGRVADATIANIFLVKEKTIITPALTEGCVAGVMRRYLLENLSLMGYNVEEGTISVDQLEQAEELFLTNAINGIRWVKQFGQKTYTNTHSSKIYQALLQTFWS